MDALFPGMDPYLEHPLLWGDFHLRFIVMLANQVQACLRPRYVASIASRTFREWRVPRFGPDLIVNENRAGQTPDSARVSRPVDAPIMLELEDVQVSESRVEILDVTDHEKVVTAIEVVSPSNKRLGPGRRSYRRKRREMLADKINVIEIDVLRTGRHVLCIPRWCVEELQPYNYLVCVNRWPHRNRFQLYPWRLRERMPCIAAPLADADPDVPLDIHAAFARVYTHASYPLFVHYDEPCKPPLEPSDQQWADERLGRVPRGAPGTVPATGILVGHLPCRWP